MNEPTSTALAPVGAAPYALTSASLAFEPRTTSDALALAQVLCASGLMPKGAARPEAAFFVIATGRELGLTALQSLRSIHVVDGKPTMSADLMIALCKRAPQCERFALVESTAERATYATTRRGEGETRMTFSADDAARAGLAAKDVWRKYPAAMLRARCASALARAVYPDVLLSVYDSDSGELEVDRDPAPAYVVAERPAPVVAPTVVAEPARPAPAGPAPTDAERLDGVRAMASLRGTLDDLRELSREVGRMFPAGHPLRGQAVAVLSARKAELEPPREPGQEG